MALPACFQLADLYPRVKAEAARKLLEEGWSQSKAATELQVSQAMVSKYAAKDGDGDPVVQALTKQLLRHVTESAPHAEWCDTARPFAGQETQFQDFANAEVLLLDASPDVMPQIGVNLALLVDNAVLDYPSRLTAKHGQWIRTAPAELGGDGHLAHRLRAMHQANPNIRALANIRGGEDIRAKISCDEQEPGENGFQQTLHANVTAVHDPGDFGIEPCLYVGGTSATDVATRIIQVQP